MPLLDKYKEFEWTTLYLLSFHLMIINPHIRVITQVFLTTAVEKIHFNRILILIVYLLIYGVMMQYNVPKQVSYQ